MGSVMASSMVWVEISMGEGRILTSSKLMSVLISPEEIEESLGFFVCLVVLQRVLVSLGLVGVWLEIVDEGGGLEVRCRVGDSWVGGGGEQGKAQILRSLEWGFSKGSGWAFLLIERLVKMVDKVWLEVCGGGVNCGLVSLEEGLVGLKDVGGGDGMGSIEKVSMGMGWASFIGGGRRRFGLSPGSVTK